MSDDPSDQVPTQDQEQQEESSPPTDQAPTEEQPSMNLKLEIKELTR